MRTYIIATRSCFCAQGKATLLLGPPGAGKSHLQKVLSGREVNDKLNRVSHQ